MLSASVFVEDGNIVSTRSRSEGDRDYEALGDALEPRPTVVLVNRDTASAAEILTAALQQNGLAEVVGTRTYGKGTFQEVMDLPAGGALDLTVGEYLTADGTSILGEGVKPDVRVGRRPADADPRRGPRPRPRGSRAALSFVGVVARRGRFLVVEPLFERGPQTSLAGGVRVRGGEMVLAEPHGARARIVAELGDPAARRATWPRR